MTSKECCGTCRFLKNGECHRNPPFLMIIGSAYGSQKYSAVWPKIEDRFNWCGEFKPTDIVEYDAGQAPYYPPPRIEQ